METGKPFLLIHIQRQKPGEFNIELWVISVDELIWPTISSVKIVQWVSESLQPFEVVHDRRFQSLMKTRRPGYHLPHTRTVARDMRLVFIWAKEQMAKTLQVS